MISKLRIKNLKCASQKLRWFSINQLHYTNEAHSTNKEIDWKSKWNWFDDSTFDTDAIKTQYSNFHNKHKEDLFEPVDFIQKRFLPFKKHHNLLKITNFSVSASTHSDNTSIKKLLYSMGLETDKIVYLTDHNGRPNGAVLCNVKMPINSQILEELNKSKFVNFPLGEFLADRITKLKHNSTSQFSVCVVNIPKGAPRKILTAKMICDGDYDIQLCRSCTNIEGTKAEFSSAVSALKSRLKERSKSLDKLLDLRKHLISQTLSLDRIKSKMTLKKHRLISTRTRILSRLADDDNGRRTINLAILKLATHAFQNLSEKERIFLEVINDTLQSDELSSLHSPELKEALQNLSHTKLGFELIESLPILVSKGTKDGYKMKEVELKSFSSLKIMDNPMINVNTGELLYSQEQKKDFKALQNYDPFDTDESYLNDYMTNFFEVILQVKAIEQSVREIDEKRQEIVDSFPVNTDAGQLALYNKERHFLKKIENLNQVFTEEKSSPSPNFLQREWGLSFKVVTDKSILNETWNYSL